MPAITIKAFDSYYDRSCETNCRVSRKVKTEEELETAEEQFTKLGHEYFGYYTENGIRITGSVHARYFLNLKT